MSMVISIYATVRTLPPREFPHGLISTRDRSDPTLMPYIEQMISRLIAPPGRQMTQMIFNTIAHLRRTRQSCAIDLPTDSIPAFLQWCSSANAIFLTPDLDLRDPAGHALFKAGDASHDPDAMLPYPGDARERKAATERRLAEKGLAVAKGLPPVVAEAEVVTRSPIEAARRATALIAVAVRGESLNDNDPIPAADLRALLPTLEQSLSPVERAFLANDRPDRAAIVKHTWRYEGAALLHWALGLTDTLPWPTEICDVPRTARIGLEKLPKIADGSLSLRPIPEILDALDLHLRLHWITREARRTSRTDPANLDSGVLEERHRALNWLTCFEDQDWDHVDTPT